MKVGQHQRQGRQQIPFGDDNKKSTGDNKKSTDNNKKNKCNRKDGMQGSLSAARFTMGTEGRGRNDSWCLSSGGFGCPVVAAVLVLGGKNPGIENGEVWWNDGEEEQEDADHLWDVKHVSVLKEERQADQ
jgi:hypothetical protein